MPVGGPGGGLAWGKGTPSSLLEAQSAWPWRRPAGPRGRRRGAAGLRGNSCRQRAGPPRAPVPRFNCCFPASPEHPVLAFGALRREPHGRPVSGGSSGGSPPVCAPSCPSGSHVGGTGLGVTETQRGTCPSVSWTRVLVTAKDALGLPGRVWRTLSRDALTRGVTDGALREKDPCFPDPVGRVGGRARERTFEEGAADRGRTGARSSLPSGPCTWGVLASWKTSPRRRILKHLIKK